MEDAFKGKDQKHADELLQIKMDNKRLDQKVEELNNHIIYLKTQKPLVQEKPRDTAWSVVKEPSSNLSSY
jgi:hypothetical protein